MTVLDADTGRCRHRVFGIVRLFPAHDDPLAFAHDLTLRAGPQLLRLDRNEAVRTVRNGQLLRAVGSVGGFRLGRNNPLGNDVPRVNLITVLDHDLVALGNVQRIGEDLGVGHVNLPRLTFDDLCLAVNLADERHPLGHPRLE